MVYLVLLAAGSAGLHLFVKRAWHARRMELRADKTTQSVLTGCATAGYKLILACLKPTIDRLLAAPPLAPPPSATPSFSPDPASAAVLPAVSPPLLPSAASGGTQVAGPLGQGTPGVAAQGTGTPSGRPQGGTQPLSYIAVPQEGQAAQQGVGQGVLSTAPPNLQAQVQNGAVDAFGAAARGRRLRARRRRRARVAQRPT